MGWVVCLWERKCSGVLGHGGVTCLCGGLCVSMRNPTSIYLRTSYVPLGTVLGDGDVTANKSL